VSEVVENKSEARVWPWFLISRAGSKRFRFFAALVKYSFSSAEEITGIPTALKGCVVPIQTPSGRVSFSNVLYRYHDLIQVLPVLRRFNRFRFIGRETALIHASRPRE
jgi:hypothetical protein